MTIPSTFNLYNALQSSHVGSWIGQRIINIRDLPVETVISNLPGAAGDVRVRPDHTVEGRRPDSNEWTNVDDTAINKAVDDDLYWNRPIDQLSPKVRISYDPTAVDKPVTGDWVKALNLLTKLNGAVYGSWDPLDHKSAKVGRGAFFTASDSPFLTWLTPPELEDVSFAVQAVYKALESTKLDRDEDSYSSIMCWDVEVVKRVSSLMKSGMIQEVDLLHALSQMDKTGSDQSMEEWIHKGLPMDAIEDGLVETYDHEIDVESRVTGSLGEYIGDVLWDVAGIAGEGLTITMGGVKLKGGVPGWMINDYLQALRDGRMDRLDRNGLHTVKISLVTPLYCVMDMKLHVRWRTRKSTVMRQLAVEFRKHATDWMSLGSRIVGPKKIVMGDKGSTGLKDFRCRMWDWDSLLSREDYIIMVEAECRWRRDVAVAFDRAASMLEMFPELDEIVGF